VNIRNAWDLARQAVQHLAAIQRLLEQLVDDRKDTH
jgi:hypothetical protein